MARVGTGREMGSIARVVLVTPAVYVPLDLRTLLAGPKAEARRPRAFLLPRALFALSYLCYLLVGGLCMWMPPRAAERAAGVEVPGDASCLRATRHADFATVQVGVGTPVVEMALLLRLDELLHADSNASSMRLFTQQALASSTVTCSAARECDDVLLLSRGVSAGFHFAVGRFEYTHPAEEHGVASATAGVVGELRLREGNSYWLTATHFCWKPHHAGGPASGGVRVGLSASRGLQASVADLAAYSMTSSVPAARYAPQCEPVRDDSTVALFPASAGLEASWLSISNADMYNSEPDSLSQRRLVAEVGVPCASDVSALQGALSLYSMDCVAARACRSEPSVPFRRAAVASLYLDARSPQPRIWIEATDALRQLPRLASAADATLLGIAKLGLITLSAAIVYVRSKRHTASSSWLFKHCMATAAGRPAAVADSAMTPVEDAALGAVAVLARAAIVGARLSALAADGQTRVLATEAAGALLSAVHWLLRYVVLEKDTAEGELPISKLGGPTAIVDSTSAVMLAFSDVPTMVASLGRFDPTARLLVGLLVSTFVVSRAAFSACCCGVLLDAEGSDRDRTAYRRILAYSCGAWLVQSACLAVLMTDMLVVPASYSMSRTIVGSQLPSRLLLFAALVCAGLPRLMKTCRNILDDKEHRD